MSKKILIFDGGSNTLEVQDEDDECSFLYIQNITHITKDKSEYGTTNRCFDFFNGDGSVGFVTNVKEIKEIKEVW